MSKNLITAIFKIVFFAYFIMVTLFLLIPMPAGGEPLINDKVAHALIFFLLSLFIAQAYPHLNFIKTLAPGLVIYGITIELLQGISGYRSFSLLDFGADIIGIILYVCTAGLIYKMTRNPAVDHRKKIGDSFYPVRAKAQDKFR